MAWKCVLGLTLAFTVSANLGNKNETFESRLVQVSKVCGEEDTPNSTRKSTSLPLSNFLVLPARGLSFCVNNKVASSSFARLFAQLVGVQPFLESERIYSALRPRTENELHRALNNTFKFMVVRHPYFRLVSAYRDRLILHPSSWQARTFTPQIRSSGARRSSPNSTALPPTFRQFVQYLVRTPVERYDPHWVPYNVRCLPCLISYDAILRLETLHKDFEELRRRTAPAIPESLGLQYLQVSLEVDRSEEISLVKAHLLQLSAIERKMLHNIYESDFKLFGYESDIL